MAFKIGVIYRITNRYIEVIHDKDIFSKPVSSGNGLHIVGQLNSYISIPLYNAQSAIGIIFEQYEPSKEKETLFSVKEECIISKVRLIGTFNPLKNTFKKGIDFSPTLNSDVFTIEESQLESIYNSSINSDSPTLQIGNDIYFSKVCINADPNILFGKHCAIFGNTGSGKSCTVTSILQSIYLEKNRLFNVEDKKLKTIIIDSNEEYSEIFNQNNVKPNWVEIKDFNTLELSHKDLSFFEITELLKEDSHNVIPYIKDAMCLLKNSTNVDDKVYYEFSDLEEGIINAVPKVPDRTGRMVDDTFTIGFLKHVIKRIKNYTTDERMACIFKKSGNSIESFLNNTNQSVLILSLRVSNDVLSLISYMICKSIYNFKSDIARNKDKENILLVLEEAHRYISINSNDLINNYYVEKVAREGRKFGINLMVSTQRPSEVSNTVISQCNSLIVHKITNNKDLEFIRNTIEYDDKSQIDLLTSLKQQQALVLGEAFAFSSLIRIANADPLPQSETPKIFINKKNIQSSDLEVLE